MSSSDIQTTKNPQYIEFVDGICIVWEECERAGETIRRPKRIDDFEVPLWWECQWRRGTCTRTHCKMCRELDAFLEELENDPPEFTDDQSDGFDHASAELIDEGMFGGEEDTGSRDDIRQPSRSVEEVGADESDADAEIDFWEREGTPVAEVMGWRKQFYDVIESAGAEGGVWTEEGVAGELIWYVNIFCAKVFRIFGSAPVFDDPFGERDIDTLYTEHVLKTCGVIITDAFTELARIEPSLRPFARAFDDLEKLVITALYRMKS